MGFPIPGWIWYLLALLNSFYLNGGRLGNENIFLFIFYFLFLQTSQLCQIIDNINLFIHIYWSLIDGQQQDMIWAKVSRDIFRVKSTFYIWEISALDGSPDTDLWPSGWCSWSEDTLSNVQEHITSLILSPLSTAAKSLTFCVERIKWRCYLSKINLMLPKFILTP